jgi:hypothetical protein
MRRGIKVFFSAFFFHFVFIALVISQTPETENSVQAPETAEPPALPERERHWVSALGGVFFSNVLLYSFNRYVGQYDFAQIRLEDLREKFQEGWEWDHDVFATNQFAHPYHGSTYHAAARANGFGFYESIFFDTLGSASWELFTETTPLSLNDLISTTLGGASLGEMFHRLYLEINFPLGGLVSPLDAFNAAVTRRKLPKQSGRNIYGLSVASGIDRNVSLRYGRAGSLALKTWDAMAVNLDCHVIYGNPFEQQSRRPYDHFEMTFGGSYGGDPWYEMHIISDGYLFSFSPGAGAQKNMSTGLSLNYDFFTDQNIDFFSQGLDWTVKYRRLFRNSALELKAHAGWTAFGAASLNFYDPNRQIEETSRDYGTGANAKFFFSWTHPRWGNFSLDALFYGMFIISRDSPEAQGWDFYCRFRFSYEYPLGDRVAVGVNNVLQSKNGYYAAVPGTRKMTNAVSIYGKFIIGPFKN